MRQNSKKKSGETFGCRYGCGTTKDRESKRDRHEYVRHGAVYGDPKKKFGKLAPMFGSRIGETSQTGESARKFQEILQSFPEGFVIEGGEADPDLRTEDDVPVSREFEDLRQEVRVLAQGVQTLLRKEEEERRQKEQEQFRAQTQAELRAQVQEALKGLDAALQARVEERCRMLGYCTLEQARQIAKEIQAAVEKPATEDAGGGKAESKEGHRTAKEFLVCPTCGPVFQKEINTNPLRYLDPEVVQQIQEHLRRKIARSSGDPKQDKKWFM